MQQERNGLSSDQGLAMDALLAAKPISEAATRARVSQGELLTWLDDPVFRGELARRRRVLLDSARGQISNLVPTAIDCLSKALLSPEHAGIALELVRALGLLDREAGPVDAPAKSGSGKKTATTPRMG